MENVEKNNKLVDQFYLLCQDREGPIPYSLELGDESSEKKVFICAGIHGNEVGSIPAILRYINDVLDGKIQIKCHLPAHLSQSSLLLLLLVLASRERARASSSSRSSLSWEALLLWSSS